MSEQKRRYTDLSTSFEGSDWDYVLEKKSVKLTDAFKVGTAAALGLKRQDITVTEFVILGRLLVQFRVQHTADMTEADMRKKIDEYPYEEVWALYEERPAVSRTSHDVGFEADDWGYVDRMKHEQIIECFRTGAAKACGVEEGDITNITILTHPRIMQISCVVSHSPDVHDSHINTFLNRYDFNEVWDLYEEKPVGKESGPLTKIFEGEDWDNTLEQSEPALRDAFMIDTSKALKIPRSAVTIKDLKVGSLIVDYTVRSNNMEDDEINALVDQYPYPEVWSMYKPRQTRRSAPTNQRIFKGSAWDIVVEKKREELKEAFAEDTAETLQTSKEGVQLTSLYTTEGGLVMNFRADKEEMSHEEVEKAVREGEYPRTWELYRQWSDEGFVETEHEVGFNGEDWDYVMEKNKETLMDTFKMCTAEEMELQSRHVGELQPTVDEKGVSFAFSLKHPKEWSQKEVDDKLKNCAYTAVWELYETRPFDPSRVIVTSHEINFEGEDWDYTIEQKRADVETAIKEDVSRVLGIEPNAVTEVKLTTQKKGLSVAAKTAHPAVLDQEMADTDLNRAEYPLTWKCYLKRPAPVATPRSIPAATPRSGKGLSNLFIREFDGMDWDLALQYKRDRLGLTFAKDTADVLQISHENVKVEDLSLTSTGSLLVRYRIRDLPLSEEKAISLTDNYAYPSTWTLYHSRERDGGPLPVTPRRRSGSRAP